MTLAAGTSTSHRAGVALAVVAAFGFSFKAILVKLAYPTLTLLFGVVLHGFTALVGMVGPLLTIVFARLLLDEGFSTAQMIGAVLVIAGVAAVSRR